MKLARFDADSCCFPKPRVSVLPTRPELQFSGRCLVGVGKRGVASQYRHFARGRYALGEAYRLAGVSREGALLAPAYHCVTMLDPALALGAAVQLYPLHADLSPDLDKLDRLLAASGKTVNALLATHFFGFTQDFSSLKHWCEAHRIVLIEDCSHVLFTEHFHSTGAGLYGRFVTASPYKFFACPDGGLLYSPGIPLPDSVITKSPGLIPELRGIKRTLEKFRSAGSMVKDIAKIDLQLEALDPCPVPVPNEQITAYTQPSSLYTAADSKTTALRSSRFIVRHSSIEANIRARQNNYRRWLKAIEMLPNCHALFSDLPESCTPYMFPLHIDHPASHFYLLKHLGVPIWRWDEMAVSDCQVAQDYRMHLLHLPCHQSLSTEQIDWMIAAFEKTMHRAAQGVL